MIQDARPLKAQVAQTPLLVNEMNFFVAIYEALYRIFVRRNYKSQFQFYILEFTKNIFLSRFLISKPKCKSQRCQISTGMMGAVAAG